MVDKKSKNFRTVECLIFLLHIYRKNLHHVGKWFRPCIIPRAIQQIFDLCSPSDSIGISFYEIHNEKAFDLLSFSQLKVPLILREENGGEFYLPQLKQLWTESSQEAKELLEKGLKTRSIGSTASNENSSRSHAIFRFVHSAEKRENSSLKKIRQINLLVISLIRTMLSRNFCQKSAKINFRNFHTSYDTLWKNE